MQSKLNITEDGDFLLSDVVRRHDAQSYGASIFMSGEFGGGTATLQVSPDGGDTKYPVLDVYGNEVVLTIPDYTNFVLGNPSNNFGELKLFVNVTGATDADITVINYDNR